MQRRQGLGIREEELPTLLETVEPYLSIGRGLPLALNAHIIIFEYCRGIPDGIDGCGPFSKVIENPLILKVTYGF